MSSEPVAIKVEPPDEFLLPDKSASPGFAETREPDNSGRNSASAGTSSHDTRNFTCLLCEVICENRDELRRHLKTYHASKHGTFNNYVNNLISPEAAIAGLSTYMNYRYTCSLCGAKFRTLRSYLSHNMSHRSLGGAARTTFEDSSSMATILNNGKQYLQEYFDSDDGYPGNFTCNECNTVFTQRDSYAMHMMMRAMNETCQLAPPASILPGSSPAKSEPVDPDDDVRGHTPTANVNDVTTSPSDQIPKPDIAVNVQQKCLEDVTSNVDQDEYLKSVLDKVLTPEEPKHDSSQVPTSRHHSGERKMCKFCGANFLDQDSLAMHVMSDHSEEMTKGGTNGRSDPHSMKFLKYSNWLAQNQNLVLNYNCKYCGETFVTRDSLAMHVLSHAHQDAKKSELQASLKRQRDFDHETFMTESQRAKLLRRVGQFNHLSLRQQKARDHTTAQQPEPRETERLFCDKCNITFYLRSEYDWHIRNYHETTENGEMEPLCLKKLSPKQKHGGAPLTNNTENNIMKEPGLVGSLDRAVPALPKPPPKPRRNSFSYDRSPRNRDSAAPRRPMSADDCATMVSEASHQNRSGSKTPTMYSSGKSNRFTNANNGVPNLNALSSNEQRIIFSVFGKNLNFKKENGDNEHTVANETSSIDDNNYNHFKLNNKDDTQSLPADLTLPKSPAISTSGETLSSEPPTSGSSANGSDIVVANEQDGRLRMLNSDMDAPMCKYCDIVFFNKAIYYLHMGLHNVNNPWQCNVCGKCCTDAVDFAAHVIHM